PSASNLTTIGRCVVKIRCCYTVKRQPVLPPLIEAAMSPQPVVRRTTHRRLYLLLCSLVAATGVARAQEVAPPAYVAFVEGAAPIYGRGRRITTDGGATPATRGSGFPIVRSPRRGSRGELRLAT